MVLVKMILVSRAPAMPLLHLKTDRNAFGVRPFAHAVSLTMVAYLRLVVALIRFQATLFGVRSALRVGVQSWPLASMTVSPQRVGVSSLHRIALCAI